MSYTRRTIDKSRKKRQRGRQGQRGQKGQGRQISSFVSAVSAVFAVSAVPKKGTRQRVALDNQKKLNYNQLKNVV